MITRILKPLFVFGLLLLSVVTFSQNCRNFAKKKCMPELAPYIHDGQFNVTTLAPGETAQMYMTFYSGQEYRILACADNAVLGDKVILRLRDASRNVIFDNTKHDYINWWVFNVKSSQQLIVEVTIPKNGDLKTAGCVSILVGFLNEEGKLSK